MRPIDADALMEKMKHRWERFGRESDCICLIEDAPTIDAVPVVHGYWIIKPHGTYGQLRAFCSACGKHSGIGGIVSNQKKPYCPNCGARMNGETERGNTYSHGTIDMPKCAIKQIIADGERKEQSDEQADC